MRQIQHVDFVDFVDLFKAWFDRVENSASVDDVEGDVCRGEGCIDGVKYV